MRVLVTWGSKRGGTAGIARIVAEELRDAGYDVDALPARQALGTRGFDAVVIGGALYANRWAPDARRLVRRRARELARVPVWFFSSGPLDDSAASGEIAPTLQVEVLMRRVGAQGHVTFGGRLEPDAKGFPASAMAREHSGDFRDPERIRAWARGIARTLPHARPKPVIELPGRSPARLFAHGAVGWLLCGVTMGVLLLATTEAAAVVVHAVLAPMIFVGVARHYFRTRGAREPLPTALAFTGVVALLDVVIVAALVLRTHAFLLSFAGFWLPLLLIFVATLATGAIMSTMPWPKPPQLRDASSL